MKQKISYETTFIDVSQKICREYGFLDLNIVKVNALGGFYAIYCQLNSEKELERLWDKINSIVAMEISDFLKNDYERWNIYCFYNSKGKVNNSLKYKIENDTFFCRKIVISDKKTEINMIDLIDEFIINSDICIELEKNMVPEKYTPSTNIYNMLDIANSKNKEYINELYAQILKVSQEPIQ